MKKFILFFAITSFSISHFPFNCSAQYTKLLDFAGAANGRWPGCSLVYENNFLYGMTAYGGTNDQGTVFKLNPDGSEYVKLMDFNGFISGSTPCGSLISDGIYLYGMAEQGGTFNLGTIFKVKSDGSGFSKLLDFSGLNGSLPYGSLISVGSYLYGMTSGGGTYNEGAVFKIKPDGSDYTKLLDFTHINGSNPSGSLIYDGNFLYGMTIIGGINDMGVVFKIKPDGTGYSKMLDFTGVLNGARPYGSLISDGTFMYGMTYAGGLYDMGTIFRIKPDGSGYEKLLDFEGISNGSKPYDSFFFDGNFLYGMTMKGGISDYGVIFKIRTDGNDYMKLLDFTGFTNGSGPRGTLISDGIFLYGTACTGGINDFGVVFSLGDILSIEGPNNNNVCIYPNPAGNFVTIAKTDRFKDGTVSIYSINGYLLMQQSTRELKTVLDISMLAKGVYALKLCDFENAVVKRIVKN